MNKPGFNENNQMISKLPLPDAVEGAKPVDYYTYVLLHNQLGDVICKIRDLQEKNNHNVNIINQHTESIVSIREKIIKINGVLKEILDHIADIWKKI